MRLKDHIIRDVVTNLRDVAIEFHAAGQLRERLRHALEPLLTQQVDRIAPAPDDAPQVVADELPELPEPHWKRNGSYSMEQMMTYAHAALAAAPVQAQEPVARVSDRFASDDGTNDEITAYLPVGTALYRAPAAQCDAKGAERIVALLEAIRDGVPLEEPVSVCKAMMARRQARVVLDKGVGPLAAVHLVNIGVGGWVHTETTAAAYADGFNRGADWLRSSIIEYADKLPSASAAVAAKAASCAPVAMPDGKEFARIEHERNTLAQAVADAALKSGIWNGKGTLTGPRLLTMLDDMASCIDAPAAQGEVACNQDPLCDLRFDVAIDAIAASKAGT